MDQPTDRAAAARFDPAMRDAVLGWFDAHGRDLAFRRTRDPYAVLVSELMAQQTQIGRASDAWVAWMARFPTVRVLADASPAEVLRQWQGLGYNRRALNLHRAAKAIVADHGGVVPDTVEVLKTLPGIGPYTARAVVAIAFGRREGAVDTNVRRVLGRSVAGDPERLDAAELQAIADDAVPPDRPGAWTHALMDIGATCCRPADPRCDACPVRPFCRFAAAPPARRARAAPGTATEPRFTSTTRWLRGRIVDRLRRPTAGPRSTTRSGTTTSLRSPARSMDLFETGSSSWILRPLPGGAPACRSFDRSRSSAPGRPGMACGSDLARDRGGDPAGPGCAPHPRASPAKRQDPLASAVAPCVGSPQRPRGRRDPLGHLGREQQDRSWGREGRRGRPPGPGARSPTRTTRGSNGSLAARLARHVTCPADPKGVRDPLGHRGGEQQDR